MLRLRGYESTRYAVVYRGSIVVCRGLAWSGCYLSWEHLVDCSTAAVVYAGSAAPNKRGRLVGLGWGWESELLRLGDSDVEVE